jgi:lipopolysaccharide/colanic/teichoic acid biosynthesis glycosyltransferase
MDRVLRFRGWGAWPYLLMAGAALCASMAIVFARGTVLGDVVLAAATLAVALIGLDDRRRRTTRDATFESPEGLVTDEAVLDRIVARELARARRYGRPLALLTVSVDAGATRSDGAAPEMATVGRALVESLRVTDVVAQVEPRRVLAALPDTTRAAAAALAARIVGRLEPATRSRLRVGVAAFPQDEVTWLGLQGAAIEDEKRSDDDEGGGRPHSASRRRGRRAPARRGRTPAQHVRRAVDIAVVVALAPLAVPLVALFALAAAVESPGPVFVRHRRVGLGGKRVEILKLRTMVPNAEDLKQSLAHLNVRAWPDFKIPNDPRVTRVGRFLRRTSLDELPQLWNLLRGDVTLVGPRPCSIDVAKYELWQTERLEAVPGLFGRWQAVGRGSAEFDDRCRMDIAQIRDTSVAGQARLAAATVSGVVQGRGAD